MLNTRLHSPFPSRSVSFRISGPSQAGPHFYHARPLLNKHLRGPFIKQQVSILIKQQFPLPSSMGPDFYQATIGHPFNKQVGFISSKNKGPFFIKQGPNFPKQAPISTSRAPLPIKPGHNFIKQLPPFFPQIWPLLK